MSHPLLRIIVFVIGWIAVPAATRADSESGAGAGAYARERRVAHLRAGLDALHGLGADPRDALERELHDGIRAKCRPAGRPASIACMSDMARAVCGQRPDTAACFAASDVILANQHAESDLIDEPTRMRFVQAGGDFHGAVLAELRRRNALLAAELALFAPTDPDLAARIDRFCTTRDAAVHRCGADRAAKSCIPSLPWQRCGAGLVWYIASHDGAGARPR